MEIGFGIKQGSTQRFTCEGERLPVTKVRFLPCQVKRIKSLKSDGYWALQLQVGKKLREVHITEKEAGEFKKGGKIKAASLFAPGDLVKVTGTSKGKGFTGVMKRWGFKGGPRTHGQSDRQRSPGSIGQSATPGRVFKGKKMPGRSGGAKVTIRNLTIMAVDEAQGEVLIKGLIPGANRGVVRVEKVGQDRRFKPLRKADEKIGVKQVVDEKKDKKSKKEVKKEAVVKKKTGKDA